ncbi:MAG TPA: ABC transporter ATP-binding protein [Bacteroidales bacterium]|nr:ABC transporter ATP-binding protein [Bacteroidales bacterium]
MILETFKLSKSYGTIQAADDVSLEVEKGTAFGLLGPNGSGKTTTLGIIMSVLKPERGSFKWFGKEPEPSVYKRIGSLVEVPNFFNYLSLRRNLEIVARIRGTGDSDIKRVLDLTGLRNRSSSRYDTLSLGMKQRLALASIIMGNPEVLVLDEPANSLDPEGIAEVRKIIMEQKEQGKTIIMASHILDEVEKVCSHVAILKKGKTLASGRVNELLVTDDILVIDSGNNELLKKGLLEKGLVKKAELRDNILEVIPSSGVSSGIINAYAAEKDINVNQLYIKKSTLEEQFLELVKE